MEILVSCVGDLATIGGSVGRDLGPATPLVRSHSHSLSLSPLLLLLLLFSPRCFGEWKVLLWQLLCAVTQEFLRRDDGSRTREGSGRCLDKYSAGA